MARPVTWWRLYRGKVWHVGWAGDAAACGTEPGKAAEYVGERAPVNARVCGDCVSMALHLYALAQAGQMGDPRTPERGLIGVPGAPLPEVGEESQTVDLVAALRASVEAARERRMASEVAEWLCECGHSNLDHDVDGMQWCRATGECLCPGLKRAG